MIGDQDSRGLARVTVASCVPVVDTFGLQLSISLMQLVRNLGTVAK